MLKALRHFDRVGRAGHDTKIAHGAEFEVVNKFVQRFFLFASLIYIKFGYDLDRCIGASQFTRRAPGAGVFIVLIMWHYHFTLEAFW